MGRDYFMIGGIPGGWGGFFWGLPSRSRRQSRAQSGSLTAGRLFWQEQWCGAKTNGNTPFALNPLADLTYPEWVSGVRVVLLLAEKLWAHRFFCPANQLASSLLSSPWKRRGCPAWRQISTPAEAGSKPNSVMGGASAWQEWGILILQKYLDLWQ